MEGQNNIVEPKKKSPIGLIILIIILMIGCLIGGYFLNESGILSGKKDTQKEEKEPVVTNYEVTDAKVAKLIDNIMRNGGDCQVLKIYANDQKVTASNISNEMAFRIAERETFNSGRESYTLDEMIAIVQKYLGKSYKFNPIDQLGKGKCFSYYYDAASKKFIKQETACGWTCGPSSTYKIVKAVDTDGTLELNVKAIFTSYDGGKDGFYSDYAMTNRVGSYEDNVDSLLSKGSDYIFTFKLEDDNYVFVSSEPAK